jgi:phospholipid/cholesterol/gamma-HCH transport system ATP-binding protein
MIDFVDMYKRFGEREVLRGVSLHVEAGTVQFIIGSSGAGKSVLVKHLVGLIRADSGRILLDGEEITHRSERDFYPIRKKCAMVFQHATLFDSMTLLENVALPLRKHRGMDDAEASEHAMAMLEQVQMAEMAHRMPAEVGDGLRKRVAIARALTLDPQVMIFDEPTTALDPMAAANVDVLIRTLADEKGVTSIVVSHDLRSIFSIADRVAMIYQGRIRVDGTTEEIRRSEDAVVQQFIQGRPEGPMEL